MTTGLKAVVTLRDEGGAILFRGTTNADGKIDLEIDYRALRYGQSVEATAIWRSVALKAHESLTPGVGRYKVVVTRDGAPPEWWATDIDQCE